MCDFYFYFYCYPAPSTLYVFSGRCVNDNLKCPEFSQTKSSIALFTEWSIERQVLQSQCKRLEAQNYNLTRTAEQLSLTMGVRILSLHTACLHLCECVRFQIFRSGVGIFRTLGAESSSSVTENCAYPSFGQELVSQRQKVREERERLQAELEHFRMCLTLPNIHWGRGQVNGHAPRWPSTQTVTPLTAKEQ